MHCDNVLRGLLLSFKGFQKLMFPPSMDPAKGEINLFQFTFEAFIRQQENAAAAHLVLSLSSLLSSLIFFLFCFLADVI